MDFIAILSIFVLACFVGYYVVWLAGVVMASINIFGGFAVTERMLAMYKKKEK